MKLCDKRACSFDNWYPQLERWSIKAEYIPIPDEVVEFLRSDIVTVPLEAVVRRKKTMNVDDVTYKQWDSDDEGDTDDDVVPPSFPEFSAILSEMLERFGGKAFVKLNWSAPTDAAWIATNNSLKCSNLQDIYLLLKSSNKISCDLEAKCSGPPQFYLVFKRWLDIHPGSEFRCFVSEGELIAITQRNNADFCQYIQLNMRSIIQSVADFFNSHLREALVLSRYSVDIIWTSADSVQIVDVNCFEDETSNPGLFSWNELKRMKYIEGESPEFRYIGEDIGIQPSRQTQHFGLPIDLTEISQDKSQSIINLLQAQVGAQLNKE